ncbi:MAG: PD-(D/E)XK nuclease family protein [candidate division WOR-3 bacterium]|nr:PD-(D/E)XK nuclease family protein [candidate division WOR-3 bacterium]
MKGIIYLAPFGKQKTTELLLTKAIESITGNDFSEILYIGPTPRKIREAQITFTKLVNFSGFIPPEFYTIKQFAYDVFEKYAKNKRVLSDFIRPLLIKKLAPEITIGYAQSLADFIREIKQYHPDTSIDELRTKIQQELSAKGIIGYEEIQKQIFSAVDILIQYNELLEKNNWVDAEDILKTTTELIQDKLTIKTLVLDGFFYDLTRLEEKLVCELINKAKKIFALSFYDSRTPEAYALPQEFLTFLRNLNVLSEEKLPDLPEIRSDLPYYVFSSIEDEVEAIASTIKKNFFDQKLSLNHTIVTFSRLRDYESLVRRTFTKYGLPYSIYLTKPLSKTQPVIAVLELLRAIINGYPRSSTVAVLSSPYFKRFSNATKEWVGHYSKLAGIIKDKIDWQGFATRTISAIEDDRELSRQEKQTINDVQKEINTFLALTSKFKQPKNSLSGYAQGLRQLLSQLEWCQGLETDNSQPDSNQAIIQQIIKIKNELYRILDQIENFESDFGKTDYTEDEFLRIFEYLLNYHQLLPEVEVKGVAVLEFLETRGLDCDHLFFGGLSEDKFPGEPKYDPVLPLWLKQKLNLPSLERHLARAKFHYFRLVNTARFDTFLSYYDTDADRLLLPSPFLGNNQRNFEPFNIIFTHEQNARCQGAIEQINFTEFMAPVNFSQDPEIQKILSQKFGPTHRFSVTYLEKYPRCPYRFYLENVLELSTIEEPRYEIEAKLWGNISHKIMERLYQKQIIPIERLGQEIEKALNAVLQEEKLPVFWQEALRRIFNDLIPDILNIEQQMRTQGFQPLQIEQYFTANLDGIKLSARIDRIDGKTLSNDPTLKQVRILDYKTGKIGNITSNHIESGYHLQLPLYAYIVKKNKPKLQIIDVGIYSLTDSKVYWLIAKDATKVKPQDLERLIESAVSHTKKIVHQIRNGIFDLKPVYSNDCQICDYVPICPLKTQEANLNISFDTAEEEVV